MTEKFLDYLRYERNARPHTVKNYETTLRMFENFFIEKDPQANWASVDADMIRDFIEQLIDEGKKATTVNRHLSALRTFFKFTLKRNLLPTDPSHIVKNPKTEKPLPQYLRESEMDRLLDQIPWDDNINDVRARTIILLFYELGLRRAELTALNDADVDLERNEIKVTGKRDKQRIVPFGKEVREAINHYRQERDAKPRNDTSALFVNDKGERMTDSQIYRLVKSQLTKVTTIKKRSPHVLRHTFATAMLNNGAGLEEVKKLLGHESVATTEIYTHTTFEQLKRIYKKAHPRE